MRWRKAQELPPAALLITSPYDPEAHYSIKRDTQWLSYKVHLTETCDPGLPNLIMQVETTPATTPDVAGIGPIQADLSRKGLLPGEHLVDGGYLEAEHLVASQQQGVDLYGPVPLDTSWQQQAGQGFAVSCFAIDWAAQVAVCPQGKRSVGWSTKQEKGGQTIILVQFATKDCRKCDQRSLCTHSKTAPRTLKLRPQAQQGGPAESSRPPSHGGVPAGIGGPCRGGGHAVAGRAGMWGTTGALPRSEESASAAHPDGGGDQLAAYGGLGGGNPVCSNASFAPGSPGCRIASSICNLHQQLQEIIYQQYPSVLGRAVTSCAKP